MADIARLAKEHGVYQFDSDLNVIINYNALRNFAEAYHEQKCAESESAGCVSQKIPSFKGLIIAGITSDEAKKIVDNHYGAVMWCNNKAYPTDGVICILNSPSPQPDKVAMLFEVSELLKTANCPECGDKSGAYYDRYGNIYQCQWCYEAKQALDKLGESK